MTKLFAEAIEEIEPTEPVEYLQLKERHCRALLDKRGSDGLLLSCGRTRAKENGSYVSSYCLHHDRLYAPGRYAPKHGGYIDGKVSQGY